MFIWIAIIAYLLFAINAVIDKFLLEEKRIGHPATYAFAIGILSLLAVVLIPFGFSLPSGEEIALSFLAGGLFTFALLAFFAALKKDEASRVVPVVGGFVPFFTLILAYFLIGERLQRADLMAFGLLIAGSLLITTKTPLTSPLMRGERGGWGEIKEGVLPLLAAFLFASSFTLTKSVFNELGFVNGFIWTRLGMAAGALIILFVYKPLPFIPSHKGRGTKKQRIPSPWWGGEGRGARKGSLWTLFLLGQAIGALAGFGQNYAIALGSVTLVNALAGVQFVFLFAMTSFLSILYPRILREDMTKTILTQKIAAIVLISLGVAVLAF